MALVYNPTASCSNEPRAHGLALATLAGKTVGFIDNAKPNFNFLADDLAQLLAERYGAATAIVRSKRGASMPAPQTMVDELSAQCDLVITGSGD